MLPETPRGVRNTTFFDHKVFFLGDLSFTARGTRVLGYLRRHIDCNLHQAFPPISPDFSPSVSNFFQISEHGIIRAQSFSNIRDNLRWKYHLFLSKLGSARFAKDILEWVYGTEFP